MNIDKIREELSRIEKESNTEKEFYFNQYIYTDYYEMKHVYAHPLNDDYYLIGDYDWYMFYIDLAKQLNQFLDDLIHPSYHDDDDAFELAIKAISIKRHIDQELVKFGESQTEIYADLFDLKVEIPDDSAEHLRINTITRELDEVIDDLHFIMRKYGLISNDLNPGFKNNFRSEQNQEKIKWERNMQDLVCFLKFLSHINLIFLPTDIVKTVENHFHIQKLSGINEKSIRRTYYKFDFRKENFFHQYPFLIDLQNLSF